MHLDKTHSCHGAVAMVTSPSELVGVVCNTVCVDSDSNEQICTYNKKDDELCKTYLSIR